MNRAAAAGLPIWPSLANDSTNPTATDQLLNNPSAVNTLINEMVAAIRYDGYKGINVDFEGMLATRQGSLHRVHPATRNSGPRPRRQADRRHRAPRLRRREPVLGRL